MRILTRYVAKAYLRMFALCMGAFIAIYLVVDFMEKIARFTRSDAHSIISPYFSSPRPRRS